MWLRKTQQNLLYYIKSKVVKENATKSFILYQIDKNIVDKTDPRSTTDPTSKHRPNIALNRSVIKAESSKTTNSSAKKTPQIPPPNFATLVYYFQQTGSIIPFVDLKKTSELKQIVEMRGLNDRILQPSYVQKCAKMPLFWSLLVCPNCKHANLASRAETKQIARLFASFNP